MKNDWDKISSRIFTFLSGFTDLENDLFRIKLFTEDGLDTISPEEARWFFVPNPNIMIFADEDEEEIVFSKSKDVELAQIQGLLSQINKLAAENSGTNVRVQNFNKVLQPKHFSFIAKQRRKNMKSDISEARISKLHGYTKTSYQQLGEVKVIYRHNKAVNEENPASRVRNIRKIYIESDGHKYEFPNNCVVGARAMARHLYEGGEWDDPVAQYICEASLRYKELREFIRYANRNKSLIEGNETAVKLVREAIQQIKYDFKKFTQPTTYADYRDKFAEGFKQPETTNTDELKNKFTIKQFQEKLEGVLPFVAGLLQEKNDFEKSIEEALESGFHVSYKPRFSNAIAFESTTAKVAYRLRETANVIENETLSAFLGRISEKISSNQALEPFEIKVVKEILERVKDDEFEKEQISEEEKLLSKINKRLYELSDVSQILKK